MKRRLEGAFTLVELLMVVMIIGIGAGMIVMMPRGDQRRAAVEAAANELAETMRLAHNMALDHRCIYALVFNITNAPGTSGLVINNWSGGHWYQILGPDDSPIDLNFTGWTMNNNGEPMCPFPLFAPSIGESLSSFLAGVHSSWVGDRHILPARKVRFLALTDQDNGEDSLNSSGLPTFYPTYPRFWFGFYDNSTHRLRPWGGYDTTTPGPKSVTISNGSNYTFAYNPSGFFFEGPDATTGGIVGCINPTTLMTTDATTASVLPGNAVELLHAGSPRPLVNGDWMDYAILFLPDGTIRRYHFGAPRLLSYVYHANDPSGVGKLGDLLQFGVGLQTPSGDAGSITQNSVNSGYPFAIDPATNFFDRTGRLFITLAPDIDQDTDVFGNVDQAYKSIMPAYRVGISAIGSVEVYPVHTTLAPGTTLDTSFSNWQTSKNTLYQWNELTNSNGSPHGTPIIDRLTTTMMTTPQCWSNP
jgi:prepilin-type N-terminal cleavage/methylation domain-containing protein